MKSNHTIATQAGHDAAPFQASVQATSPVATNGLYCPTTEDLETVGGGATDNHEVSEVPELAAVRQPEAAGVNIEVPSSLNGPPDALIAGLSNIPMKSKDVDPDNALPAAKVRRASPLERLYDGLPPAIQAKIDEAATCFYRRKRRLEHPKGSFDNAQRWYPDDSECFNTTAIRSPSRQYPYSYLVACRTAKHCAHLSGVDEYTKLVVMRERQFALIAVLAGVHP